MPFDLTEIGVDRDFSDLLLAKDLLDKQIKSIGALNDQSLLTDEEKYNELIAVNIDLDALKKEYLSENKSNVKLYIEQISFAVSFVLCVFFALLIMSYHDSTTLNFGVNLDDTISQYDSMFSSTHTIVAFQKTSIEDNVLRVYGTYYNPVALRVQSLQCQKLRQAIADKIQEELNGVGYSSLVQIELMNLFNVHALTEPQRRSIVYLLENDIANYFELIPDDTNLMLLSAFLHVRVGDWEAIRVYFRRVFAEIDKVAVSVCSVPHNYVTVATNPAQNEWLTDEQRVKYTILVDSQNGDCENLKLFRSLIVSEFVVYLSTESRDAADPQRRASVLYESFAFQEENYRFVTTLGLRDWRALVMLKPNSFYVDPPTTASSFQFKSLLRHHMQMFYHLYNKTTFSCNIDGRFRTNVLAQHESCRAAEELFLSLSTAYEKALSAESLVVHGSSTELGSGIHTLGREGGTLQQRGMNDLAYLTEDLLGPLRPSLSRHVHSALADPVPGGIVSSDPAKWDRLNAQWLGGNKSSVLVIDDAFTPAGIAALNEYLEDNTMWHYGKSSGILSAHSDNGFSSPLVAQTASELQAVMPAVICDHKFSRAWAVKHPDGGNSDGTRHADSAAVSVNCWTGPDEGIGEGKAGGMVVWPVKIPSMLVADGNYNGRGSSFTVGLRDDLKYDVIETQDEMSTERGRKVNDFIDGVDAIGVPYRQNRCVIFDSAFIHATDTLKFEVGYRSRRTNLTFLFGKINGSCANAAAWKFAGRKNAELRRLEKISRRQI